MADVLIRDLPGEVFAAIDANARRLGLSRNEYLRRHLAGEVRTRRASVTVDDLRRSAGVFADNRRSGRDGRRLGLTGRVRRNRQSNHHVGWRQVGLRSARAGH